MTAPWSFVGISSDRVWATNSLGCGLQQVAAQADDGCLVEFDVGQGLVGRVQG